jgi:hypothetical protein
MSIKTKYLLSINFPKNIGDQPDDFFVVQLSS